MNAGLVPDLVASAPDPEPVPIPTLSGSHWHASLVLGFGFTSRGTRLMHKRHEGPLYVQRPFYPEGNALAHVYLLHPPGGLVSGDDLRIHLTLDAQAQVLCTTPGAGRVYRARSDRRLQRQHVRLDVGSAASLEWFPQETLVFPGAMTALDTDIRLSHGARFCAWDLVVLGLPANGVTFNRGSLRQTFRITRDGLPLLRESLRVDEATPLMRSADAALRGQPVSGLFACGPFAPATLAAIDTAALRSAIVLQPGALQGLTRHGELLVGRYLGPCAEEARRVFMVWWRTLRPLLLQRPACAPAIWNT